MLPFIPLQFLSFKTNLSIEQAIAILGRSIPIKREIGDKGETISFKYQPHRPIKHSGMGAGVVVYVRYHSDLAGVYVKVTIMPSILIMCFYIFAFGIILSNFEISLNTSNAVFLALAFLFFYLLVWWETIETKRAIRSMFHDVIIK